MQKLSDFYLHLSTTLQIPAGTLQSMWRSESCGLRAQISKATDDHMIQLEDVRMIKKLIRAYTKSNAACAKLNPARSGFI